MHTPKNLRQCQGMTLLEIMVVVTIMGIIAAVVVVNVAGFVDNARVQTAKTQISNFKQCLQLYQMEFGSYPSAGEGLRALTKINPKTNRPFMEKIPKDPWGRAYRYTLQNNGFEIICLGADGRRGGSGVNADIKSSDL